MTIYILHNPFLEQAAASLKALISKIQSGELYRNVEFLRISPAPWNTLSPQNRDITALSQLFLQIHSFLHNSSATSRAYPIQAESKDMGFMLTSIPGFCSPNSLGQIAPSLLTIQISPSQANPQTSLGLVIVPPTLASKILPTAIHRDVDFDFQLTFSYLPYLEEACGPIFEVNAVVVQREDIKWWLETSSREGRFDDMQLEIVKGPTRTFDEAGECWVVSLILI